MDDKRTTEMVERAAAAIAEKYAPAVDQRAPYAKIMAREAARAAIETMREPTFNPEDVNYSPDMSRADWWRAMVDAALTSQQRGNEK